MKYRVVASVLLSYEFDIEAESPEQASSLCEGFVEDTSYIRQSTTAHDGQRETANSSDLSLAVYDDSQADEDPVYESP